MKPRPEGDWLHSVRRILPLAWPVLIGQLAVLTFGTIDTLLVARHGATDLAALAVGSAAYLTVYIGLMGVVQAVAPIVGQLHGAARHVEAGRQLHQAGWLALALSIPGCGLLLFPAPFMALSEATAEVARRMGDYLGYLAYALPAALLFTAFRGFNTAVSRPKTIMLLQLGALALKLPLSAVLVFGASVTTPWGRIGWPAMGAAGGGLATALIMWLQVIVAWQVLRRDPFYARYQLPQRGVYRPDLASLRSLLRLGVPLGASVLVEITGFTFMALFISRMGAAAVAGHQLAANLVTLMFVLPMSLGNATSTLVSQRLGASDAQDAHRIAWHGLRTALLLACFLGALVYLGRRQVLQLYTHDESIIATAMPLLAWVAVFHVADAAQTLASFILRAYRIVSVPLLIYAGAIWGVGLGGGFVLAFDRSGQWPAELHGARGFWAAATAGLVLAGTGLSAFMAWRMHKDSRA